MKGRLLVVLTVLSLGLAACAGGEVSGGDDEASTNELQDVSTTAMTTPGSIAEPATDPGKPATEASEPVTETTADTQPSLVTNPPKEIPATSTTSTTVSTSGEPSVDPGLLPLIEQAKADLAGRLGVGTGSIALVAAELVEWPDASLGCPQPGMVYAQIPSDGSRIVLSYGGAEYRYHTGGSQYVPFLCE